MAAGIAVDSKWQAKEVKEERVRGREREKKAKGTKKRVNGGMWRPRFVQTFSRQKKKAKFKPTFVLKHLPQFKNVCLVTADQCMDVYTSLISTPNINVCLTLFCLSSCKNLTTANLSHRPF